MRVVKLTKEDWATLSEKAHLIAFNEHRDPISERVDFAIIVEDGYGKPMIYITARELDRESLYWQYGGAFPDTRGTGKTKECVEEVLNWCKQNNYRRVFFYTENTNVPMLKLAMNLRFRAVGIRNYKHHVLLEHFREF